MARRVDRRRSTAVNSRVERRADVPRRLTGRTSFIGTHRLSSVRDANPIIVLGRGRVVESGDHQTLLASSGLYAHLFHQQFLDVTA